MNRSNIALATSVLLSLIASRVEACTDPTDPAQFGALQIAQIKSSAGRAHFYDAACDAGAKGLEACRRKAYVQPGDVVLIGDIHDTTACATFVDKKGRATSGIIKASTVEPVRGADQSTRRAFVGRWVREEAEISVTAKGPALAFKGEATYGSKDPQRVARGAVNSGNIDFTADPASNRLSVGLSGPDGATAVAKDKVAATDCQLDMIVLGPYLVVKDNMQCGGMNVSFTGVYRRK